MDMMLHQIRNVYGALMLVPTSCFDLVDTELLVFRAVSALKSASNAELSSQPKLDLVCCVIWLTILKNCFDCPSMIHVSISSLGFDFRANVFMKVYK